MTGTTDITYTGLETEGGEEGAGRLSGPTVRRPEPAAVPVRHAGLEPRSEAPHAHSLKSRGAAGWGLATLPPRRTRTTRCASPLQVW